MVRINWFEKVKPHCIYAKQGKVFTQLGMTKQCRNDSTKWKYSNQSSHTYNSSVR